MSATVEPRQVTRYYCSVCGRNWAKRRDATKHTAAGCWDDPETRHCHTCCHSHDGWPCDTTSDDGDDFWTGGGTDPKTVAPCEDWEPALAATERGNAGEGERT